MRLLGLSLIALAFAQPTFAREHYRHHHLAYRMHSYQHAVASPGRRDVWRTDRWRQDGETTGIWQQDTRSTGFAERDRSWNAPMPERAHGFASREGHGQLDAMIASHAQQEGVPEALVHRVVIRESRYKPGVVGAGGAMGLMQIKLGTAREMGYGGTAAGLLDPETNLTYAVRYLAGAYRVAGGNADRAVANYARGYRDATVREGAATRRRVASSGNSQWSNSNTHWSDSNSGSHWSNDNSRWSNSYASAGPAEQVAWVRAPARHYHAWRGTIRPH